MRAKQDLLEAGLPCTLAPVLQSAPGSAAELLETHIGALDARIEELTAQRDELGPAFRPTLSKTCAAVEHAIAHLKTWRMLSLIFNLPVLKRDCSAARPACLQDMERPPLDPLRVPSTELEDESGGRYAQCGACPGCRVG